MVYAVREWGVALTIASRACREAASSSATVGREVASVPQPAAIIPRMKPSSKNQKKPRDSTPSQADTAGSRKRGRCDPRRPVLPNAGAGSNQGRSSVLLRVGDESGR